MKSLAIEREFGSGGREIGMRVAQLAGIPYYDSELLRQTAERSGVPMGTLKDFDEKWTGSLLYELSMAADYAQSGAQKDLYQMYYALTETIRNLAAQGPAVFIGRSSTEILRERPGVVKAYIYASDGEKKLQRIMDTERVSRMEAERLRARKDRARKNYFKFWTQKDWEARGNYDLELNSSALGVEASAALLLRAMEL